MTGEGAHLFETYRTAAFEVPEHRSIGAGAYLATYLNDLFLPPGERPDVALAETIAAYIVSKAKKYIQFCGGSTFVRTLTDQGTDERIWQPEIVASEEYLEKFFVSVGRIRSRLKAGVSDVDMAPFAEILKNDFLALRVKQDHWRSKRAAIRERVLSRRQSH